MVVGYFVLSLDGDWTILISKSSVLILNSYLIMKKVSNELKKPINIWFYAASKCNK